MKTGRQALRLAHRCLASVLAVSALLLLVDCDRVTKKCVAVFTNCNCSYECRVEAMAHPYCMVVCEPAAIAAAKPIRCAWSGLTCQQAP